MRRAAAESGVGPGTSLQRGQGVLRRGQRSGPRGAHAPIDLGSGADTAVSNQPYVNQSTYDPSVYETQNTQDLGVVSPDYNQAKLQGSVDSALVEALLQMLVGLAQNQGLPKYKLNEIIDFLKDFLTQGGTPAVGDTGAVGGSGQQSGDVHLDAGEVIKVGDVTVVPMDENGRHTSSQPYENAVFILPGQTVEVNGLKITNDTVPSTSLYAYIDQPQPAPVTTQPVISNPVVSQPAQPIISAQDFADRFTKPLLMQDGTWTRATNSLAEKAFGIPVGTPMAQVDLTKLQWQPGAQGTVTAPVSSGGQDVAPTRSAGPASAPSEINSKMAEAGDLLKKINNGTASKFDVNDFLSKLQEIAKLFSEAVGNGAQDGARKTKKGAQAQAQGGASGAGEGTKATGFGAAVGVPGGADVAAGSVGADFKAAGFDTSTGSAPGFDGSTTGKSWLMAIAEAMGSVLGSKVQQMLTSSSKMSSLTINQRGISQAQTAINNKLKDEGSKITDYKAYTEWKEKAIQPQLDEIENQAKLNGQEFTEESSKLQGASQEFSMLQNAFSNCIKSIGEGLGQLARKG